MLNQFYGEQLLRQRYHEKNIVIENEAEKRETEMGLPVKANRRRCLESKSGYSIFSFTSSIARDLQCFRKSKVYLPQSDFLVASVSLGLVSQLWISTTSRVSQLLWHSANLAARKSKRKLTGPGAVPGLVGKREPSSRCCRCHRQWCMAWSQDLKHGRWDCVVHRSVAAAATSHRRYID